jgi:integrase
LGEGHAGCLAVNSWNQEWAVVPLCLPRDKLWGQGISEKTVWHFVKKAAASMKIPQLSSHDLRRTCARLCHASGGELEQIQFLLGHISVQTTERYIGCKQRFRAALNDKLGIEPG